MERTQAIDLVRNTFTFGFDEAQFSVFVRNLVNHFDETKRSQWSGNYIKRAFASHVGHYLRLGTYSDPRGERIDILVVHLHRDTTLTRGRVTLRNFVADYLVDGHGRGKAAVIAAFVSPREEDWRFSFIKLDYTLETTELGLVTERRQLTPARRYSFLVGGNENCHTAQKQFLELLETDTADPTVAALEAAFSVEKVTKEFFAHYRDLFERSCDALRSIIETAPLIAGHFEERGITCEDFAKKLLGQIVFLYFLQKKGWFGVERGRPWGSGRRDFIRYLFEQAEHRRNFFNDILEPLFYEALASPRLDDDHYYSRFDCRIPFLNGGLFEPLYGYKWVEADILLPDSLFSNEEVSSEGDVGTGILDVFDRYNFTVNEAEPLEREVAVDPEMLGKVFENLLPENLRHSSGTYYTPRVIVHYMCQQGLLHYLAVRAPDIVREELAMFLRLAERFTDFEEKKTKAHHDKRLPDAISQNASRLDELLANVSVCDPAIGSGAFPVGMMHEIVRARMALTAALHSTAKGTQRSAYTLKRHAIHHSLYGVDEDPGAVEIAKLRLWLSMVVDEDEISEIQPLPNLDYKIMQGNSLLDEFDGIRLLDERLLLDEERIPDPRLLLIDERQQAVQKELLRLQATGRLTHKLACDLKDAAGNLAKERKSILAGSRQVNDKQGDLGLDSRHGLKRIRQLHAELFDESSRVRKERLRTELEGLEWDFMRATLREDGRERALAELEKASKKHRKPFFLWRLHFAEVFQQQGGFDVVIANPPYVRMELIKDQKPALERRFPHLFGGRADLYVYFYGIGLEILRDGGCLAFISSNSYLNSKFGGKLRQHFLETTNLKTLIDFAETNVFDAVVEPAIIVLQKQSPTDGTVVTVKWEDTQPLSDLPEVLAKKATALPQASLSADPWQLVDSNAARILMEMRRGRKTLLEHPEWKPLRGVVTGLNDAFVIDSAVRAQLLKDNPECSEIIHPFLRGRDIAKWSASFSDTYIIYTYHGVNISRFPAVEKHLLPFLPALKRRATVQEWYELQQPQMAYETHFRGPKLVYQEINRTDAFAYDKGEPTGMFVNNKVFFIPNAPMSLLALLNSTVASFFLHTLSGVPEGGFLALQLNIVQPLPIPDWTDDQQKLLGILADYLLLLHRRGGDTAKNENVERRRLLAGYFQQWVNALVYELFFPEQLHSAGLRFFQLTEAVRLRAITDMEGNEFSELSNLFEELYSPMNPLRQGLYALDSIEAVRIIEGKS